MDNNEILKCNDGKKFDICLMNPPYDNGLHLSFLKKVSEISDKIVSIQPCNWLFLKSQQKRTKDVRDLVDKYYTECDVYEHSMDLFGGIAAFKSSITISYIDTKKEDDIIKVNIRERNSNSVYHSIDDVKLFGQDPIWESIYKKIVLDKRPKIENYACVYEDLGGGNFGSVKKVAKAVKRDTHEFDGKWVFTHTTMAGHLAKDCLPSADWYTIVGKNSRGIKPLKFEEAKDILSIFYVFDTEEECQNMIDYIKTDFARIILYMTKIDMKSITLDQFAPWLDFTQHWDDAKLFKEFGISEEEQKRIREVLPDYYGIRK